MVLIKPSWENILTVDDDDDDDAVVVQLAIGGGIQMMMMAASVQKVTSSLKKRNQCAGQSMAASLGLIWGLACLHLFSSSFSFPSPLGKGSTH